MHMNTHKHTYIHIIPINEKDPEAVNLREQGEEYMGEVGGRERKWKIDIIIF